MNERTGWDWGFAAVTTLITLAALAVGVAAGAWLGLTALTDDPAAATRTTLRALVVAVIAADVLWMARRMAAYRQARRKP